MIDVFSIALEYLHQVARYEGTRQLAEHELSAIHPGQGLGALPITMHKLLVCDIQVNYLLNQLRALCVDQADVDRVLNNARKFRETRGIDNGKV